MPTTNYYRVDNQDYDADDLLVGGDGVQAHRKRIEPWLSAIFQSEHLNLLLGSGFSTAISSAAGVPPLTMGAIAINGEFDDFITAAAQTSARRMGRGAANIEDQLRTALTLLDGLEILGDPRRVQLKADIETALANFANSVISMESGINLSGVFDDDDERRYKAQLLGFLLSFASRTATRDRLHVFTTNYDRIIEHGFDLLGVRTMDRFVGALSPRFRASRFDVDIHYRPSGSKVDARPLEGVVKMTKLHGSVDWVMNDELVRLGVPFGGPHTFAAAHALRTIVYPNSSKDVETALFPYAEMFRDLSAALCRPNTALVTYGYGFGDEHINRVIRDMLTLPSTHLVIISYDDAQGRIPRFQESLGRPAQISTIIGSSLAALGPLVDHYLPKPAIDVITERRARIVENRGRADQPAPAHLPNDVAPSGNAE